MRLTWRARDTPHEFLQVCSASDLVALSADDIFNKLRTLLLAVLFLFSIMHIGAWIAFRRGQYDGQVLRRKLMDPAQCKFEEAGSEGAWTWVLDQARQEPLARSESLLRPPVKSCHVVSSLLCRRARTPDTN